MPLGRQVGKKDGAIAFLAAECFGLDTEADKFRIISDIVAENDSELRPLDRRPQDFAPLVDIGLGMGNDAAVVGGTMIGQKMAEDRAGGNPGQIDPVSVDRESLNNGVDELFDAVQRFFNQPSLGSTLQKGIFIPGFGNKKGNPTSAAKRNPFCLFDRASRIPLQ